MAAKASLLQRFEPENKQGLYMAEFWMQEKQPKEDWVSFGEDLKTLADKAVTDIEESARVHRCQLVPDAKEDPQLAFSVRQKEPKKLNEGVAYTLLMQSHFHLAGRYLADTAVQPGLVAGVTDYWMQDLQRSDALRQFVLRMESWALV